ncbi:MAG: hypothetical protein ACHQNT_08320 [Bacteroidia bacterium]
MKIFLALILLVYLYFSIKIQRRILKYHVFTRNQKIIHSILVWLLPFIWGFILTAILKKPLPGSAEFFEERNNHDSGYYESGTGHLGGGIL